ncbi:hypothetical protein [Streptomyces cucumeris]|uniref:hypothetical protein n=1 Tax=Streptomyces cucumeris TaxID=2962890 RepID=UPI003D73B74F
MKSFIGHHLVATDTDYLELALGAPLDLWLGESDESVEEYAARLDAARDIIAENPELIDRVTRIAAKAIETHTSTLLNRVGPHPRPGCGTSRPVPKAVAA